MTKTLQGKTVLHNGVEMPYFGIGVYKVQSGDEVYHTVKTALELGYRLVDTASFYDNEEGVGQAIKDSGIPREELFITTKVWNSEQGYESTLEAFDRSLRKLGLEYLDLYLIHWPIRAHYLETWRAMEKLYEEGKVRAIGVSNFLIENLDDLISHSKHVPTVNQVELHPLLSQVELREYCARHQIAVEAWSPLGRGHLLDHPVINEIGKKYNKTAAQVILRWHVQNDIIVIPKSITPARIKENSEIFDFKLTSEDMEKINQLNENKRFGSDPKVIQYQS